MNPVLSLVLKALVVAGLGLVAVLAGSPVVTALFRRADPPRADPAWPEGQPPSPAATPPVAVEPTSDAQLAAPALGEGAVPPTSATPAVAAEPVPAAAAPAPMTSR